MVFFCLFVLAFNLFLSFLVLQATLSSLDWSRWVTEDVQVASLWHVLTYPQDIAPLSEKHARQFTPHFSRFFYTSVGSTFIFSVSTLFFCNCSVCSNMSKRFYSNLCCEQFTRRGLSLALLQAVWSLPQQLRLACTELRQVLMAYRHPSGKPSFFGPCTPHQGASVPVSQNVFRRLSVAAFASLLRFHRSNLGDRKLHVAKPVLLKPPSVVSSSLPALSLSHILTGCSGNA